MEKVEEEKKVSDADITSNIQVEPEKLYLNLEEGKPSKSNIVMNNCDYS